MSATKFCDLVESTLLELLPRRYRRTDGKLTTSERDRIEKAFDITWKLVQRINAPESASLTKDDLLQMKLPDLLRIKETATFLASNITQTDRESVASASQQAGDSTRAYDDAFIVDGCFKIQSIFADRVVNERGSAFGYPIPDEAPLDIFTFFDQWQDDVADCASIN